MIFTNEKFENYIVKLRYYIQNNGPEEFEWEDYTELLNDIYFCIQHHRFSEEEINIFLIEFKKIFKKDSIHWHIFNQPYGYPGDFSVIDKFYKKQVNAKFLKWENYVVNSPAAKALRNRIDYFIDTIKKTLNGEQINILNIASGPCRDVKIFFDNNKDSNTLFDCVEFDNRAIEYAKSVLNSYSEKVNFINKNALRFTTTKKYDLIWSGGLFDYFDDKVFIRLLKRYVTFLKLEGELVFGNFHPINPSKAYMELVNWKLNYRTEYELLRLAEQAGLVIDNISIKAEPLGINLFLHYKNKN